MSKLLGLSQIENAGSNSSNTHLSFDQDLFSNYLEPNQNDVFDTRRFSLQPENKPKTNTASSKAMRSNTPACRSKTTSRTNSARVLTKSTFGNMSLNPGPQTKLKKKVENLEKKEELWKERANVWDKERKVYQKALENVISSQIDPSSFYKNQLDSWRARSYLKKVSIDLSNSPLQELKNIFEWICSQPDSVPFKSIKLSFVKISSKIEEIESLLSQKPSEDFQVLSSKNLELSNQVLENQAKIASQSQEIENFLSEIRVLKKNISDKEQEIENLQNNQEAGFNSRTQSELESKDYDLLMAVTEIKRLSNDLAQSNKSNEVYIKTIEQLRAKVPVSVNRSFALNDSSTQTVRKIRNPKLRADRSALSYPDFLQFTSCMASAIEALIDR